MEEFYIVEVHDRMGFTDVLGYFKALHKAQNYFRKQLYELKKDLELAKADDGDEYKNNGKVIEGSKYEFQKDILFSAVLAYWETWSNEDGTESDITSKELVIKKATLI